MKLSGRLLYLMALALVLAGVLIAILLQHSIDSDTSEIDQSTSTPATTTPIVASSTSITERPAAKLSGRGEVRLTAYTTAYTWWDNTPPGSSIIAFRKTDGFSTLHDIASGTGTYADPITIAVGHVRKNGIDKPDFAPGTRFYIPNVRAYFIVEDTCGDGLTPQDVPCHNLESADPGADVWLDMWIEGASLSTTTADACSGELTANHLAIENPADNYAVLEGPIISGGACREQFGDTLVRK